MKYLICAGCFAGNMGGDAMYETAIEAIKATPEDEFTILVKYPKDEIPICNGRGYRCVRFTTIDRIFQAIPFFVFGGLLKKLHIPYRWLAKGAVKEYFDNDVLLDFSGISFSDYRGNLDLIINLTWLLPAFISGMKIIKMPQSLGPYKRLPVRITSRYALSKVDCIMARGKESYAATRELLPKHKNILEMPDIAMNLSPVNAEKKNCILKNAGIPIDEEYICLAPSIVVDERYGHDDYCEIITGIVKYICDNTKFNIILVPHTQSLSKAAGVDYISDDLNVCKAVYSKALEYQSCMYILEDRLDSHELKAVIGGAYVSIGSRYHFLIASVSSAVPAMALGWGYKYVEMFSLFGLEKFVFEYHNFEKRSILEKVKELLSDRETIHRKISDVLPQIKQESAFSMEIAKKIAMDKRK